jgi:cytidine deaminase
LDLKTLMDTAREASSNAYAPYSNFHVGAAILTEDGTIHAGCNVENASYGLAVCAERNAAAAMVLASHEDRKIELVAVFSSDASPCFPCGACRQVLREFGCKELVVEEASGLHRYPFEELLPYSFAPEALG